AAEHAPNAQVEAWFHNMGVNNLVVTHAKNSNTNRFQCFREFDPRAQYTIGSFMDSGVDYAPSSYTQGTPYPDPTATFSVSTVAPTNGLVGTSLSMTINGSLFTSGDKVVVGSLPQITPTFVNSGTLTFTLSGANTTTLGTGTHNVTVIQGGNTSNVKTITLTQPTPTFSTISPSAVTGENNQLFTLTGTNFQSGATVKVGSLSAIAATVSNSTQITFTLTVAQMATLGFGVHTVYVTNPTGQNSNTRTITILEPASPIIDSVSPVYIPLGLPATFSIGGSSFETGAVVFAGSISNFVALSTTVTNSTSVQATITASGTQTIGPGVWTVALLNTDGKISNEYPIGIYYPLILDVTPDTFSYDTAVTLNLVGLFFDSGITATVNGTPKAITRVSSELIQVAFTPAQLSSLGVGTHTIVLQNLGGGTSPSTTFTIVEPSDVPDDEEPIDVNPPVDNPFDDVDASGGVGGGGGGVVNVPPSSFTLKTPDNNQSIIDDKPSFSWNTSEDTNLSHYQLFIDGELKEDNIKTLSVSLNKSLSCGEHKWYVRAIDASNSSVDAVPFTLTRNCGDDKTNPLPIFKD
ncbi:MAG: IPT/TIG domain-containing protein, partial [archaeon]